MTSGFNDYPFWTSYRLVEEYLIDVATRESTDLERLLIQIQDPLLNLWNSYRSGPVSIDYADPDTQKAYLYYYAAPYAVMTKMLWDAYGFHDGPSLKLRRQETARLGFFGAGPGMEAWAAAHVIRSSMERNIQYVESNEEYFWFVNISGLDSTLESLGIDGYHEIRRTGNQIQFRVAESDPARLREIGMINRLVINVLHRYPDFDIYKFGDIFHYNRDENEVSWMEGSFTLTHPKSGEPYGSRLYFTFFDIEPAWVEFRNWLYENGYKTLLEGLAHVPHPVNERLDITGPNYEQECGDYVTDLDIIHFQYCMNETLGNRELADNTLQNLKTTFQLAKEGACIVIIDNKGYTGVNEKLREFENWLPEGSIKVSFSEHLSQSNTMLRRPGGSPLPLTERGLRVRGSWDYENSILSSDTFPLSEGPVPFAEHARLERWAKTHIDCSILVVEKPYRA